VPKNLGLAERFTGDNGRYQTISSRAVRPIAPLQSRNFRLSRLALKGMSKAL